MNRNNLLLSLGLILWLSIIAYGYSLVIHYELKPNSQITSLQAWPDNSQLKLDPQRDTLIIFVHPKCPCSKASIAELDRLLTSFHDRLRTIVVFIKPEGQSESWVKGNLWTKVQSLPEVTVYIDNDNQETHNFMVDTSGEVLLFNINGKLIYHGGITASRGHEGDNKGRTLISNYLRTGTIKEKQGYAFGCTL